MTDKRCISDFRHINSRITETNFVFPLVRDTFTHLRKFQMSGIIGNQFKRCLPLTETYRRVKEVLRDIVIF